MLLVILIYAWNLNKTSKEASVSYHIYLCEQACGPRCQCHAVETGAVLSQVFRGKGWWFAFGRCRLREARACAENPPAGLG